MSKAVFIYTIHMSGIDHRKDFNSFRTPQMSIKSRGTGTETCNLFIYTPHLALDAL